MLPRHAISDEDFDRIKDLLPGKAGDPGVTARDNRLFLDRRLKKLLASQGRVILAIDGLQPDVGHEVLWVIRDCLSGEILLARSLLSGRKQDLAELLAAVLVLSSLRAEWLFVSCLAAMLAFALYFVAQDLLSLASVRRHQPTYGVLPLPPQSDSENPIVTSTPQGMRRTPAMERRLQRRRVARGL